MELEDDATRLWGASACSHDLHIYFMACNTFIACNTLLDDLIDSFQVLLPLIKTHEIIFFSFPRKSVIIHQMDSTMTFQLMKICSQRYIAKKCKRH